MCAEAENNRSRDPKPNPKTLKKPTQIKTLFSAHDHNISLVQNQTTLCHFWRFEKIDFKVFLASKI